MEINVLKIPVITGPPNVALSVRVEGAAAVQRYDTAAAGAGNAFMPDRGLVPTYVVPKVSLSSGGGLADGTEKAPAVTDWFVNGKPIAEVWASADYEIAASGTDKGMLTVKRNIGVSEIAELRCRVIEPWGSENITVWSDPVSLRTTAVSESAFTVRTTGLRTFAYNPALDELDEREWDVSKGGAAISATERKVLEARPGSYLRRYPVYVNKGRSVYGGNYQVKVYKVSGNTETEVTAETDPAIVKISKEAVTFDARMADTDVLEHRYVVRAVENNKKLGEFGVRLRHIIPTLTYHAQNRSALDPAQTSRVDEVTVKCKGRVVRHPERVAGMTWKAAVSTDGNTFSTAKVVGRGSRNDMVLGKAGFAPGVKAMRLSMGPVVRKGWSRATDKTGANYYTDSNGNIYII